MQSKKTTGFYTVTIVLIVLVSVGVLVWQGMRAASTIPLKLPAMPEELASSTTTPVTTSAKFPTTATLKAAKGTLKIAIASTSEDRTRGLSGTPSLPKDSGLLFVFPKAGVY